MACLIVNHNAISNKDLLQLITILIQSVVDIIPKEPHMRLMVQMEFETAAEAKPMTQEYWNVALETFFNPSAHAFFKTQCIIFFILESARFGE